MESKRLIDSPGKTLKAMLVMKNMLIGDLARQIPCSPDIIKAILYNNHQITPEMAIKLSKALGGTSEKWLKHQKDYNDQMEKLFSSLGHRFDELG